jgi:hypothetical protein
MYLNPVILIGLFEQDKGFVIKFVFLCIIAFTTAGLFLTLSNTIVQALSTRQNTNRQITISLDVTDSIFNENITKFIGSKNILTPYPMTMTYYTDQGFL